MKTGGWYGAAPTTAEREEGERRPEERLTGSEWVRAKLGFTPDAAQARLLDTAKKRVILNCTRQWGKSTVTAARAVMEAERHAESLTLVVTPGGRQSGEYVRKARAMVRRLGYRARGDGDNEISLLLPNGSRIVGLRGDQGTVRGFSDVKLLLVDEAAWVPKEIFEAVTPSLAKSNGDVWLMSTPNGRRGFFWEEWSSGESGWERVTVKASECERLSQEYLAEELRRKGERLYRQEYCCEFLEAADSLYHHDLIEAAFTESVERLAVPAAAW